MAHLPATTCVLVPRRTRTSGSCTSWVVVGVSALRTATLGLPLNLAPPQCGQKRQTFWGYSQMTQTSTQTSTAGIMYLLFTVMEASLPETGEEICTFFRCGGCSCLVITAPSHLVALLMIIVRGMFSQFSIGPWH